VSILQEVPVSVLVILKEDTKLSVWLISRQDVEKMYEKLQGKPETFLWSDGKDDSKTVTEGDHEDGSHNCKRPLETNDRKRRRR